MSHSSSAVKKRKVTIAEGTATMVYSLGTRYGVRSGEWLLCALEGASVID